MAASAALGGAVVGALPTSAFTRLQQPGLGFADCCFHAAIGPVCAPTARLACRAHRVLAGRRADLSKHSGRLTATAASPGGATVWLGGGSRINRASSPAAAASPGSSRSVIAAGAQCPLRSIAAASARPIRPLETAALRWPGREAAARA